MSACDTGKQHDQGTKGAFVTIRDVNVGPSRTLPIDGTIQIAFDRYLLPASVTRQSVFVVDANGQPIDPVITRYDPMSRTISVSGSNASWLTPGQPYKLRFTIPPNDDVDDRGLRAIDRQTLDPNQPLEIAFFAADAAGRPAEKTVSFCGDVLPIFTMKCTSGVCHAGSPPGAGYAAGGLVLDSFTGLQKTAIGRVANSANTGGISGNASKPRGVFGIDMPIIDPGAPDNSWLLYKIELAREPVVDSGTSETWICNAKPNVETVAFPTTDPFRFDVKIEQASDRERAILNDYVAGREMPYPTAVVISPRQQALTFDERQRLRLWIAQGAKLEECGGCTPVGFIPDAGSDGGAPPTDAGTDAPSDASADAGDASTDAQDQ